jgi:hypothetical protein
LRACGAAEKMTPSPDRQADKRRIVRCRSHVAAVRRRYDRGTKRYGVRRWRSVNCSHWSVLLFNLSAHEARIMTRSTARALALVLFIGGMFFVVWCIGAGAVRWGWAFPWGIFALELLAARWLDSSERSARPRSFRWLTCVRRSNCLSRATHGARSCCSPDCL